MSEKRKVTITAISEEQCREIMDAVYRVMERNGLEIRSDKAREIYVKAGCTAEGNMVKFPRKVVEDAIASVPREITFYDREGKPALKLTPEASVFGPGISCSSTTDLYTGEVRLATMKDAVNAALVCDALENVGWASALCSVSDGNINLADVYEVEALLNNTTKPIMFWAQNINNLKAELDMISAACGPEGVSEKPHGMCLTCPMDPLIQNNDALEQIMFTAERNIPMLHVSGISFGGNAPIYLAGAIVVGMADSLAGLVLSQLVNPGAPFIIGKYNDNMNFRTVTIHRNAPEHLLASAATGDIFRYLNLINSANMGGDTTNGQIDAGAAYHVCGQHFTALLDGSNLNIGMGGYENCTVGYLPGLIFANESVGFLKVIRDGLEISEETLAVDMICEMGPGGYYITQDDTLMNFREMWEPHIFTQVTRKQKASEEDMDTRYVRRTIEIIEAGPKKPLSVEQAKRITDIRCELEKQY